MRRRRPKFDRKIRLDEPCELRGDRGKSLSLLFSQHSASKPWQRASGAYPLSAALQTAHGVTRTPYRERWTRSMFVGRGPQVRKRPPKGSLQRLVVQRSFMQPFPPGALVARWLSLPSNVSDAPAPDKVDTAREVCPEEADDSHLIGDSGTYGSLIPPLPEESTAPAEARHLRTRFILFGRNGMDFTKGNEGLASESPLHQQEAVALARRAKLGRRPKLYRKLVSLASTVDILRLQART